MTTSDQLTEALDVIERLWQLAGRAERVTRYASTGHRFTDVMVPVDTLERILEGGEIE